MRYSFVSAAVLAFASSAFSQATEGFNPVTFPTEGAVLTAGSTVEIKWQLGLFPKGSSTITLLQGNIPKNLSLGEVIATGVKNSDLKYSWAIPKNVPVHEVYGLQINLEDDKSTADVDESLNANKEKILQYSFPFKITSSGYEGPGTTTVKIGTGPAYTPPATSSSSHAHNTTLTTSASPTAKPNSNYTIPTTTRTTGASASTSTPPRQSTNAGVNNAVSGGITLVGGLFLALAL